MCYIRVDLSQGLFYKDGTGYKINLENKTAEKFPFIFDIEKIDIPKHQKVSFNNILRTAF